MSQQLTEKQITEYEKAFFSFATDNTGTIQTKDLGDLMRTLGQDPSPEELQLMVNNNTSEISAKEFIELSDFLTMMKAYRQQKNSAAIDEIMEVFKAFDKDNSGFISVAEFRQLLGDDEQIEQMIRRGEIRDAQVNYREFAQSMVVGNNAGELI